MTPDITRDAVALVESYRRLVAREWEGYDEFAEERHAILASTPSIPVLADTLALMVTVISDRFGMKGDRWLAGLARVR